MYYRIEEYEGKYYIKMTDKFYSLTVKYFAHSYLNLMYRLFNMLPRDFYHYVGFVYNASFQKNKYINFINMFFEKEDDAKEFCKELNKRFQYCVDRKDFE